MRGGVGRVVRAGSSYRETVQEPVEEAVAVKFAPDAAAE